MKNYQKCFLHTTDQRIEDWIISGDLLKMAKHELMFHIFYTLHTVTLTLCSPLPDLRAHPRRSSPSPTKMTFMTHDSPGFPPRKPEAHTIKIKHSRNLLHCQKANFILRKLYYKI